MRSSTARVFQGAFGALVVGALGFGATQALASPATTEAASCTRQDQAVCLDYCFETYGPGYRARCYKEWTGHVDCECYPFTPST